MSITVAVALALVGAVTVLNLFLLTAVMRRLRAHEAAHAPAALALPEPGHRIGAFRTTTPDALSEEDLAEPAVVLFVMPGCAPCHELLDAVPDAGFDPARTFVLVAGDAALAPTRELAALVRPLGRVAVIDPDGPVTAAFGGIRGYPTVVHVAAGRVVAADRRLSVLVRSAAGA
ncbi:hypothetical protein ACWT_6830 [Actinoplanes sp. SE50]|uniref:hypothetical protein n=1 Tax=unclassified Actinoplanes TaxID=2626549 RepID=UPI00023ED321|nr:MULTISPECIES: hypothetical protein [unclassified Actinoplanes]AEV87843.1 hypothetical protein ACPL_6961 [Actinoplanes sp. SE50/110]ATO86245.1 hypothetical protein ACWT_6830 [Actinoplanes sp. SE50]SLM03660.1 hypothetical protein ACSP50_6956 [Actinoplanes sp. SE50/110]